MDDKTLRLTMNFDLATHASSLREALEQQLIRVTEKIHYQSSVAWANAKQKYTSTVFTEMDLLIQQYRDIQEMLAAMHTIVEQSANVYSGETNYDAIEAVVTFS